MVQYTLKHHQQRGAVAVMSGLLLMLVLIPVSGLVLDLGHLYIVKTELQNHRKDGSAYWVELSLVPVPGPGGRTARTRRRGMETG